MKIRQSTESELIKILQIHAQAFGKKEGPVIARLVNALMKDETASPILSLVAVENKSLLGHILFTKAVIKNKKNYYLPNSWHP